MKRDNTPSLRLLRWTGILPCGIGIIGLLALWPYIRSEPAASILATILASLGFMIVGVGTMRANRLAVLAYAILLPGAVLIQTITHVIATHASFLRAARDLGFLWLIGLLPLIVIGTHWKHLQVTMKSSNNTQEGIAEELGKPSD